MQSLRLLNTNSTTGKVNNAAFRLKQFKEFPRETFLTLQHCPELEFYGFRDSGEYLHAFIHKHYQCKRLGCSMIPGLRPGRVLGTGSFRSRAKDIGSFSFLLNITCRAVRTNCGGDTIIGFLTMDLTKNGVQLLCHRSEMNALSLGRKYILY